MAAALIAGCSAGSGSLGLPMPIPTTAADFPGSTTDVYTRIARGALACWFGPKGELDRSYIFFAKAEPESKGGEAEILIHERVEDNKRGLKAFRIQIARRGEATAVATDNLKMQAALGLRMTQSVNHWARGGIGCEEGQDTWTPVDPNAKAPPAKGGAKTQKVGG